MNRTKTETKQMALPWHIEKGFSQEIINVIDNNSMVVCLMSTTTDKKIQAERADYIVQACNCHEQLLEAGKAVFFARNNPALTEENKERCWKALGDAIAKTERGADDGEI